MGGVFARAAIGTADAGGEAARGDAAAAGADYGGGHERLPGAPAAEDEPRKGDRPDDGGEGLWREGGEDGRATMSATITTSPATSAQRIEELGRIIMAYSEVTEKLQQSHEKLQETVRALREELGEKNKLLERKNRLAALG